MPVPGNVCLAIAVAVVVIAVAVAVAVAATDTDTDTAKWAQLIVAGGMVAWRRRQENLMPHVQAGVGSCRRSC